MFILICGCYILFVLDFELVLPYGTPFFLEHAGELRIIVLIEEGWSHTERPPHTPTHTQTRGEINRLLHVRSTQDPGQEHPSQQP